MDPGRHRRVGRRRRSPSSSTSSAGCRSTGGPGCPRVTVLRWLNAGRQYQLGLLAEEVDNPDGRIAEDIRVSTEFAVEFAQSILQCVLQLFTFLSVLWTLVGHAADQARRFEFDLPGYMVWAAVAYALVGSLLTYALGRGLIHAGNVRQGREADFRSGLTRAREHAEGIALMRGEDDERERLRGSLFDLRAAWHVQTRGQGNLSLLTSSLAYLAPIVPLIVALPRYLAGEIQLGGLMQTAQAFSSVQWALSWLIDNFPKFAEWRASTDRVVHLHVALTDLEDSAEAGDDGRIEVHPAGDADRLIMRELGVARPDGEMLVAEAEVEISRPERVLIRGQSGSGKSTIMRAVAGVWPWGRGAIHLPKGDITFMPQKPYFPLGTLRDAMLYPKVPEGITDEVLKDMLHKVGLDHLRDRLDETERWDHILSGGEQQRVAFARVLVHKPDWIFMDEATSALDETGQENIMKLLIEELPETSIVSIGHRPGLEVFHTRELTLPGGAGLAGYEKIFAGHRGWRRIYPDLPGMGHSVAKAGLATQDDVLEALLAFIDRVLPTRALRARRDIAGRLPGAPSPPAAGRGSQCCAVPVSAKTRDGHCRPSGRWCAMTSL